MDNFLLHRGSDWIYGRSYGMDYYNYGDFWWLIPIFAFTFFIVFALGIVNIISFWKLYKKAGLPGWTFLVPIFNMVVMLKIADRPDWWILLWFILLFIPFVNIIMSLVVLVYFVQSFGKDSVASGLLTIFFFIFYIPYLAFSKDVEYSGDEAELRNSIFR